MVYIYAKKIGSNKYYYLRLDKRINGKKIVVDVAYLGQDLSKINLDKLIDNSKYNKEIKKSYDNLNKTINTDYYIKKAESIKYKKSKYLTKEQQIRLNAIKIHFNFKFKKLNDLTKEDFFENFIVSYTYNTTSIEGNTIALSDVKKILIEEKVELKNNTLREIYDLRNTKKTFLTILNKKPKLNLKTIVDIHKSLMLDMDNRVGFRNFDVRVIKSQFNSTPYFRIEKELTELFNWFNKEREDIFIKSVIFHHKFEKIHPFADGNGRCGRMLLNLMLLNQNYPPIIVTKKNRSKYIDALSIADKKENYIPLISFLLEEYEKGYWDHFIF